MRVIKAKGSAVFSCIYYNGSKMKNFSSGDNAGKEVTREHNGTRTAIN
jgi:hypothetical protein